MRSPDRDAVAAVSVLVRGTPRARLLMSFDEVTLDHSTAIEVLKLQRRRSHF